jgi:hypothetical protein
MRNRAPPGPEPSLWAIAVAAAHPMEVTMPKMRRTSWTGFALACLLAIAAGGAAADAGKHGGHDSGGKHGDHETGGKHGGHGSGGKRSGPAGGGKHSGHGAVDQHGKMGGGHHGVLGKRVAGDVPTLAGDDFHRGKRHDSGLRKRLADDPSDPSAGRLVDGLGTAAIPARVILPGLRGSSLDLPAMLQPPGDSANPSTESPIEALPGVHSDVVRVCHDAIAAAADPLGAITVEVDSAGPVRQVGPDIRSAPVEVSIGYLRQGGVETRRAPVDCQLNATGSVIGLT